MAKLKATVRLMFDVEFEEDTSDGALRTVDQAMEAAQEKIPSGLDGDIEITHIQRLDADTTDAEDA